MRVGFIGLGHMGGPMSANILAAGHDLVVHDVRAEAAAGVLQWRVFAGRRSFRARRMKRFIKAPNDR